MKKPPSYLLILTLLLYSCFIQVNAQSYHAFSGSPYAGVTGMYNNPASTVNSAYKWDVTVFAMQSNITNTAFTIRNNSLTNNTNSAAFLTQGMRSRFFHNNIDVNLLNFRFNINSKSAFAAGVRLRTYNHYKSLPFFYSDSIKSAQNFLMANNTVPYLDGFVTHAAWAEFSFNYSRILLQNQHTRLSAGITVSYLKGLSGAFANVNRASFTQVQANGNNYFVFNQASLQAEYSDNYLVTNQNNTNTQNFKNFIKKALPSAGIDFGAEYLFKNDDNGDDEEVNATNYTWKIGASIMDIGRNRFNPIEGSFTANTPTLNLNDSNIQYQINHIKNIKQLRDTLGSLFANVDTSLGRYNISLPTRMVISVDRNLGSHFFVNGELSLNFYSTQPYSSILRTRELNLLTITPRWETQAWGLYLPVQYNTQGMLWVGAAVKIGPLLLGVHSLDFTKWFKTGTQTYNGGGYILLSIHPFKRKTEDDKMPCPNF